MALGATIQQLNVYWRLLRNLVRQEQGILMASDSHFILASAAASLSSSTPSTGVSTPIGPLLLPFCRLFSTHIFTDSIPHAFEHHQTGDKGKSLIYGLPLRDFSSSLPLRYSRTFRITLATPHISWTAPIFGVTVLTAEARHEQVARIHSPIFAATSAAMESSA